MTAHCPATPDNSAGRMSRRVSAVEEPGSPPRKRARPSSHIARQVSHDALLVPTDENQVSPKGHGEAGRGSPARCVSEYDKVAQASAMKVTSKQAPAFPNFLAAPEMYRNHRNALRLEAELHPMRLILSRLMFHTTLNRRGIFNEPVDPIKLNLPDYFKVVKKPMDLGTVKAKLHSIAYTSCKEVVEDIRRVFENAMLYNPPQNAVYAFAKELLVVLEDQLEAFVPHLSRQAEVAEIIKPTEPSSGIFETGAKFVASAFSSLRRTNALVNAGDDESTVSTEVSLAPLAKKRKKRGSKVNPTHACQHCEGRKCLICNQGCLAMEPTLLICNGASCAGARIRKGAIYFIAPDGSRQFCQRCHAGLPAVLPNVSRTDACRYKRELLKRKNDEEIVEKWLTCQSCGEGVHQICAMFNDSVQHSENFMCPECQEGNDEHEHVEENSAQDNVFTFLSGSEVPIPIDDLYGFRRPKFSSDDLPVDSISKFIEDKVRYVVRESGCVDADKTLFIRTISDCDRFFNVPEVVRYHFTAADGHFPDGIPSRVGYRSKCIALFQKQDGLDVCLFCMYVQEYENSDGQDDCQERRVYIAYLDSVEYFRPRSCRTGVYHEVLAAYLATAKKRGFSKAHIWACPPSRGNSFVFWSHPSSQKTPTRERLISWYHGAISRAVDRGIISDVASLYESSFFGIDREDDESPSPIELKSFPPLLDGDFWIEEAVRLHQSMLTRHMRSHTTDNDGMIAADHEEDDLDCPARVLAKFLREKIIALPNAKIFRRPVNAAALKLKDYHEIIRRPMDLGTVYSKCLLGEFLTLGEFVSDVRLTFDNAKKYNPPGHFVHSLAAELEERFFSELNGILKFWPDPIEREDNRASQWEAYSDVSLSLDMKLATISSAISPARAESEKVDGPRSSLKSPDLRDGGADAVMQRMVGEDTWLLEKNGKGPKAQDPKLSGKKRRLDISESGTGTKRRQTWLMEEVGAAVRRLRTSFFTCTLDSSENEERNLVDKTFEKYSKSFSVTSDSPRTSVADARHALLELSQSRCLEFNTLRRAKFSTSILLYHLHNKRAPGMVPQCTSCGNDITDVRWHKSTKVYERKAPSRWPHGNAKSRQKTFVHEELCPGCFSSHPSRDEFIPLQNSLCHP